ncbi:hypothetical protein B0H14DRAFT_3509031 [Mycena olivaceomarginata]|nr:hypothetical protein B0H14DRAFT_3509031 [Mycena olivaceomarginata]
MPSRAAVHRRSPSPTPASHLCPDLSLEAVRAHLALSTPCQPYHWLFTLMLALNFKLSSLQALYLTHQPKAPTLLLLRLCIAHQPEPPPPPLPPAHTKPPFSRPTIAPAPDSPRCSPPRMRSGGIQARPLPERSPSHSRDLSSDDSTEEYGRTQEAKRRLEAARVARGHSPATASTADDEEDLQSYLAEVGTHGFGEKDAKGEKSTTNKSERKSKAKAGTATDGKGKGRAAPPVPVSDPKPTDPNPDEVVEEDLMERGYAPGEYDLKVAALASLCNKDPATLRRAITPHELRNTSAWNMYLAHHALHQPKRPDVSVTQYNIDAQTAFEALLPGLSKAEMGKTPLVLERLPWLQSWWKKLNANHIENLRAKGQYKAQAKKAVEPLIQMAKQLSNTWGIHIFAVTIDPRDGESFAFGGGHTRWNKFAAGMIRVSSVL